jgi:hypothetical protein
MEKSDGRRACGVTCDMAIFSTATFGYGLFSLHCSFHRLYSILRQTCPTTNKPNAKTATFGIVAS